MAVATEKKLEEFTLDNGTVIRPGQRWYSKNDRMTWTFLHIYASENRDPYFGKAAIELWNETENRGGNSRWPARVLEQQFSNWSLVKDVAPCPKCDKEVPEDNDYLCHSCRWGV